ncbi:MAG: carbon monoxide dehydrogenase, partial [Deltaproteobacteria bacterium]|nr:carbon monoxide dehydrogenase [Deltaproteobacteria bacterium]
MSDLEKKSIDPATLKMIDKAIADHCETVFDRAASMKPCPIGAAGDCCKNCAMGPCRVSEPKDKTKKRPTGLCGATAATISARNFARMVAGGSAAHSDHARGIAQAFLAAAKGEVPEFKIKDEQKLYQVAMDLDVEIGNRSIREIAVEVGEKALAEFGRQNGEVQFVKRAPAKRQEIWRKTGMAPRGIDREVVELMHRTHIGVDQDYKSILLSAARCSLSDGWGGSMISTDLQDIIFGNPVPVLGQINLGVLKKDEINVVVHGHEPLLPEVLVAMVNDKEIQKAAKATGAKGINLVGMCCSANEILMRHGIPVAGNFLQQELAIVTGAVDVMVVDVQCEMQSLAQVAKCYHTKLITTSPKAKIEGALHIEFDEHHATAVAKKVLMEAIDNYKNRRANVEIPDDRTDQVVGFSYETINYLLGGMFRASYRPLNDNIINGRIRGIAGVVGCNNARVTHD